MKTRKNVTRKKIALGIIKLFVRSIVRLFLKRKNNRIKIQTGNITAMILITILFSYFCGGEKPLVHAETESIDSNFVVMDGIQYVNVEAGKVEAISTTEEVVVETETKKEAPKRMSETRFVTVVSGLPLVKNAPEEYLHYIYQGAAKHGNAPFLALGVAWKESNFNAGATSPETRYGFSRGLFQILDSTATGLLDISSKDSYNAKIAADKGNELLKLYRKTFQGNAFKGAPEKLKHFSLDKDGYPLYKGKPVVDHKGVRLDATLLAVISYNCGPMKIANAMENEGMVVLNPKHKERNIPHQTLEYVVLINKHFYNFGYSFDYTEKDVDRAKAAANL